MIITACPRWRLPTGLTHPVQAFMLASSAARSLQRGLSPIKPAELLNRKIKLFVEPEALLSECMPTWARPRPVNGAVSQLLGSSSEISLNLTPLKRNKTYFSLYPTPHAAATAHSSLMGRGSWPMFMPMIGTRHLPSYALHWA